MAHKAFVPEVGMVVIYVYGHSYHGPILHLSQILSHHDTDQNAVFFLSLLSPNGKLTTCNVLPQEICAFPEAIGSHWFDFDALPIADSQKKQLVPGNKLAIPLERLKVLLFASQQTSSGSAETEPFWLGEVSNKCWMDSETQKNFPGIAALGKKFQQFQVSSRSQQLNSYVTFTAGELQEALQDVAGLLNLLAKLVPHTD